MYIYDNEFFFEPNVNRICFLIDDETDLAYLPNTTSYGDLERAGGDNVTIEPVDAGSMAHSIATSKKYILNSNDEWIEFKSPGGSGGGGGASSLADLTDVNISNPQNDQVIAWDAETQKWVNKDMEQVVHVDYSNIENPPTINGVALTPTTTLEDLGIAPAATYDSPTESIGL